MWLGLILTQAILGAATILTDKAADVATAHVMLGALSLAAGAMLTVAACEEERRHPCRRVAVAMNSPAGMLALPVPR